MLAKAFPDGLMYDDEEEVENDNEEEDDDNKGQGNVDNRTIELCLNELENINEEEN